MSAGWMCQVCTKPCSEDAKHCEELEAWSLRLDTELIANSAFVESVQPSKQPLHLCGLRLAFNALIHAHNVSMSCQSVLH